MLDDGSHTFGRLLVIRGPVCSGKSTTGKALRRLYLQCSLIDPDVLKVMIDNRERTLWRTALAFHLTCSMVEAILIAGRVVIVEAHSHQHEHLSRLMDVATETHAIAKSVLLFPSLNICLDRNKTRHIDDIEYAVDQALIDEQWHNTFRADGELEIDTSTLSPEDIASRIHEHLAPSFGNL
jgi:predicted kinase